MVVFNFVHLKMFYKHLWEKEAVINFIEGHPRKVLLNFS